VLNLSGEDESAVASVIRLRLQLPLGNPAPKPIHGALLMLCDTHKFTIGRAQVPIRPLYRQMRSIRVGDSQHADGDMSFICLDGHNTVVYSEGNMSIRESDHGGTR